MVAVVAVVMVVVVVGGCGGGGGFDDSGCGCGGGCAVGGCFCGGGGSEIMISAQHMTVQDLQPFKHESFALTATPVVRNLHCMITIFFIDYSNLSLRGYPLG